MCGEKLDRMLHHRRMTGSPPRVRGKGIVHVFVPEKLGITPAYAGKRMLYARAVRRDRDHPRVCGEKTAPRHRLHLAKGSPPRMRGKETCKKACEVSWGITPAYAGKRPLRCHLRSAVRDHPRVCGEKMGMRSGSRFVSGSPPRMRGKGIQPRNERVAMRITPAYAGKSPRDTRDYFV